MKANLKALFLALDRIGADPTDGPDLRLNKLLLVRTCIPFIGAGALWGLFYILLAEPTAGAIPMAYAVFSAASLGFFAVTRRYQWFRLGQLLLILFLPFLLQIALGGYINASTVIIWSLICPLGALVFDDPRHAPYWFLGYLVQTWLVSRRSRPS